MAAAQLRVGGLVPLTTIDFPGKLSAVVFCQGCPWRCYYCHNTRLQSPVATESPDWSSVVSFLKARQGLLDAVVFSGGEPTAQPALIDALKTVKELGFLVGLHSAGVYPRRLRQLLPLIDWIGLDIKATKDKYTAITGDPHSGEHAWQCAQMIIDAGIDHQFRVPLADALTKQDIHAIETGLRQMGAVEIVRTLLSTAVLSPTARSTAENTQTA